MQFSGSSLFISLLAVGFVFTAAVQNAEAQQRQHAPQNKNNVQVAPTPNTNAAVKPSRSAPGASAVTSSGNTDCAGAGFNPDQAQTMTAIALAESGGKTQACRK